MEKYPTRNGISIPIHEIELPPTHFERPELHSNNHHNMWGRKTMGRTAITQTLRDLDRLQFVMPVDVHNSLHQLYAPPEKPTLRQAMDEIDEAYQLGETLKIYNLATHKYEYHPITPERLDLLKIEYNALGDDMKPAFV